MTKVNKNVHQIDFANGDRWTITHRSEEDGGKFELMLQAGDYHTSIHEFDNARDLGEAITRKFQHIESRQRMQAQLKA